ncbi:hypothetical protein OROHE_016979 [Orobanche hederae]
MALAREIMGSSLMEKSSFLGASSSSTRLALTRNWNRSFLPLEGRRVQVVIRRGSKSTTPVAAISEDLGLDLVKVMPENAVKFKVRAVATVMNKNKEDICNTQVRFRKIELSDHGGWALAGWVRQEPTGRQETAGQVRQEPESSTRYIRKT